MATSLCDDSMQTPTVNLHVPTDRPYASILYQTKTVYDQLLASKKTKLLDKLVQTKLQYEAKCTALMDKCQNEDKVLEYGVRAQEALNKLQKQTNNELRTLHIDYQMKMDKMNQQLEQEWRQEQEVGISVVESKDKKK